MTTLHQVQRPPHTRRLRIEPLEARRLLAVVTVDTELDVIDLGDGVTSLREAIFATNTVPGADEIVFGFGHDGPATILLEEGELEITDALTITGDGPDLLTIDAQQQSRIFNITAGEGDFTFAGMTLTGGKTAGNGGAIRSKVTGSLTIQNSAVSDNASTRSGTHGGGIFALGNMMVASSTITGNSSDRHEGGGISGYNITVSTSTITGNSAFFGGGIAGYNVKVTSSTIVGNSAVDGGGISGYNVKVTSSTIAGNSAEYGGGISGGKISITSSTITGNLARFRGGGGIWTRFDSFTAVLSHTIVADNSRVTDGNPPVPDDLAGNGIFELGYSLVGTAVGEINTTPGTINYFGIDPLLGPLADNGGPTQTHALLPGSPALDAGDPTIQQDPNQFDQRGEPYLRVADGNLPDDIAIDMGAYEAQIPPSADFDGDDDVDGIDFLAWQRGFGTTVGATRPDGNSDDDEDVDASDLAAWRVSFGNGGVLAVNASIVAPAALLTATTSPPTSPQTLSSAELIDAALALALAEQRAQPLENTVVADSNLNLESRHGTVSALNAPRSIVTHTGTSADPISADEDGQEENGYQDKVVDKALERVFW